MFKCWVVAVPAVSLKLPHLLALIGHLKPLQVARSPGSIAFSVWLWPVDNAMGSRELTSVVAPASPVVSNVKEEKDVNEKRPPLVALICLVLVNIVAWRWQPMAKKTMGKTMGCWDVDIHELSCHVTKVEGIDSQLIPGCLFALQLWLMDGGWQGSFFAALNLPIFLCPWTTLVGEKYRGICRYLPP